MKYKVIQTFYLGARLHKKDDVIELLEEQGKRLSDYVISIPEQEKNDNVDKSFSSPPEDKMVSNKKRGRPKIKGEIKQ